MCTVGLQYKWFKRKNLNQKKLVLSSEKMESVNCHAVSPNKKLFFEAICDPSKKCQQILTQDKQCG